MATSQQRVCYWIPQQFHGDVRRMPTMKRQNMVKDISEIMPDINVGMTTDMWTDDYCKISYLTNTYHYITPEYQLKSRVLNTVMCPQAHNVVKPGENIQRAHHTESAQCFCYEQSCLGHWPRIKHNCCTCAISSTWLPGPRIQHCVQACIWSHWTSRSQTLCWQQRY